jgi:hypothetical protein
MAIPFKKYYNDKARKKRLERLKKQQGVRYPSSVAPQNYTSTNNYINTPPQSAPFDAGGGFTDNAYPSYPSV